MASASTRDDVLIELEQAIGAEAEAFQHAASLGLLVRLGKEIDNLRLEVARIGRCNEQLSRSHAEVVNELKRQISCMLGQDKPRDSDWDNWLDGEADGEMTRLRGELQAYRIIDAAGRINTKEHRNANPADPEKQSQAAADQD